MCGATTGGRSTEGIDVAKETVIQGMVTAGGEPVGGAFVRLLDGSGEFTAEVVTSPTGEFRFFARPGDWTLRALSWQGNGEASVSATQGEVTEATVPLAK
ncbi:MAG: DUF1416 domain-containing protein [Actinomycetes bacterium]